MPKKSPFMGTTQIDPSKTASEIVQNLVEAGASQIAMDYGPGQKLTGIRFSLTVNGHLLSFALPARVEPVQKLFLAQRRKSHGYRSARFEQQDREQAERTAWRQLLRWVEAQLAMIQTGMVDPSEVFMPYMLHGSGKTMPKVFSDEKSKALPTPEKKGERHE